MANSLKAAFSELIDEDQAGFVSDQQTQDNVRRSLHLIETRARLLRPCKV